MACETGRTLWSPSTSYSTRQFISGLESTTEHGLLDVGCGTGGAAFLAAGHGARVAGLDASLDSVEVARERVPTGDFRVGDMESLPWPDGSFDVVTGSNSFQFGATRHLHSQKSAAFLRRKGGWEWRSYPAGKRAGRA
jgi:SAM-dependent methyltransferase